MITNENKSLDQIFWTNRLIVAMELFPFLMKRLLKNSFQGQFVLMHYASLLCIILYDIWTSTYEQKISCSFFSGRKKNCHRHVHRFGDMPFISLLCSRAESLKNIYFAYNKQLGKGHSKSCIYITAKHQDKGIASSTYRIHSGNFAACTHFYCTNAGGSKMGLGGGG